MTRYHLTRRRLLQQGGATLALVGSAGCLGGGDSAGATVDMTEDMAFAPETETVGVDETVTWTNSSEVTHTVTATESSIPEGAAYFASGGFESEKAAREHINEGLIAAGETYEHTFGQPGTYDYYCIPHQSSGMTGTVHVK